MSSFNKQYKINPRIRDIIEKQRGEKYNLSHSQIEYMIGNIFEGKYKPNKVFTDEDKNKIKLCLDIFSPNSYSYDELEYFSKFLKLSFNEDEVLELVKNIIKKSYKPGMVYANIRVSNKGVEKLVDLFNDIIDIEKGIIINTKFIGDVKKVYPDVIFDETSGEITDENTKDKVSDFSFTLKSKYKDDLNVIIKDDIFILTSKSEEVLTELENTKLDIQLIPLFYFND